MIRVVVYAGLVFCAPVQEHLEILVLFGLTLVFVRFPWSGSTIVQAGLDSWIEKHKITGPAGCEIDQGGIAALYDPVRVIRYEAFYPALAFLDWQSFWRRLFHPSHGVEIEVSQFALGGNLFGETRFSGSRISEYDDTHGWKLPD